MTLHLRPTPPLPQGPMTLAAFRALYEADPSDCRIELIAGRPAMMAPTTIDHQRIASNLEAALNDGLERLGSGLLAYRGIGLDLAGIAEDYHPEPDVSVIDPSRESHHRYAREAVLVAEILSPSDEARDAQKRPVYQAIPACRHVVMIRQDRFAAEIDTRTASGWQTEALEGPEAVLQLDAFGVAIPFATLYRHTRLMRR